MSDLDGVVGDVICDQRDFQEIIAGDSQSSSRLGAHTGDGNMIGGGLETGRGDTRTTVSLTPPGRFGLSRIFQRSPPKSLRNCGSVERALGLPSKEVGDLSSTLASFINDTLSSPATSPLPRPYSFSSGVSGAPLSNGWKIPNIQSTVVGPSYREASNFGHVVGNRTPLQAFLHPEATFSSKKIDHTAPTRKNSVIRGPALSPLLDVDGFSWASPPPEVNLMNDVVPVAALNGSPILRGPSTFRQGRGKSVPTYVMFNSTVARLFSVHTGPAAAEETPTDEEVSCSTHNGAGLGLVVEGPVNPQAKRLIQSAGLNGSPIVSGGVEEQGEVDPQLYASYKQAAVEETKVNDVIHSSKRVIKQTARAAELNQGGTNNKRAKVAGQDSGDLHGDAQSYANGEASEARNQLVPRIYRASRSDMDEAAA